MTTDYAIAEWFGMPFTRLSVSMRQSYARAALRQTRAPPCPFQRGSPPCSKRGGVCSIRSGDAPPVIVCPRRFDADDLLPQWLARIVGYPDIYLASEVPFMRSPATGRAAGRIDVVLASDGDASEWLGLEVQAVYFSGGGMPADFEMLLTNADSEPPPPTKRRRPDWRSSSAKRLMPQLEVKVPLLRQWGKKLAVAVDRPFFEAIGGPSAKPSQDVNDGDIVWLIPEVTADYGLAEFHWEVLPLEASSEKLLSAIQVNRQEFEGTLRGKLQRIEVPHAEA